MTQQNTRRGNTHQVVQANIGQVKPDVSRNVAEKLSGSRLTYKYCAGFTLIELLVAVLIIAILAAVALPQYQKVVRKAQAREVFVAIDSLEKALHAYYLETGRLSFFDVNTGSASLSKVLSVEIPELKHWRYNTGSPGNEPTTRFTSLQTFHASLLHYQYVWLTPTDVDINQGGSAVLYVEATWNSNTGLLESVECKGSISFPTCADYFSECPPVQPTYRIQNYCGEERIETSYNHTCKLK